MPWDYKFMPGNIVRNIVSPRVTLGNVQIPQFSNLTVLSVTRAEVGMGGFWITAGRVYHHDDGDSAITVLSGIDRQFELDPDAEQQDVPYFKVTQRHFAPPFYWPNLYLLIADARQYINDSVFHRERLMNPEWLREERKPTNIYITDAYDWIVETHRVQYQTMRVPSGQLTHTYSYLAELNLDDDLDD